MQPCLCSTERGRYAIDVRLKASKDTVQVPMSPGRHKSTPRARPSKRRTHSITVTAQWAMAGASRANCVRPPTPARSPGYSRPLPPVFCAASARPPVPYTRYVLLCARSAPTPTPFSTACRHHQQHSAGTATCPCTATRQVLTCRGWARQGNCNAAVSLISREPKKRCGDPTSWCHWTCQPNNHALAMPACGYMGRISCAAEAISGINEVPAHGPRRAGTCTPGRPGHCCQRLHAPIKTET